MVKPRLKPCDLQDKDILPLVAQVIYFGYKYPEVYNNFEFKISIKDYLNLKKYLRTRRSRFYKYGTRIAFTDNSITINSNQTKLIYKL